jgi:hypothetical protein
MAKKYRRPLGTLLALKDFHGKAWPFYVGAGVLMGLIHGGLNALDPTGSYFSLDSIKVASVVALMGAGLVTYRFGNYWARLDEKGLLLNYDRTGVRIVEANWLTSESLGAARCSGFFESLK